MTGRGDYAVVTNSLITNQSGDIVPTFGPSTDSVTITNREYIRDVYCPLTLNAFQVVDSLSLNPGLSDTFPWLSQVAINYEEFEFLQLIVTFKSTIDQSLATNGQSGQIALTTSYNPDTDPFGSKSEMMGYKGGMSCKTNQSMLHGVECDPSKNSGSAGKYIRPGYVAQQDLKNYDLGTTFLSIFDAPTQFLGVTLGELWITYTVVLRKPKLAESLNYGIGRIVGCSEVGAYLYPFGIQGDNQLQVSTKGTIPVTFVRPQPVEVIPTGVDNLSYLTPTTYTGAPAISCYIKVVFPPWYSGIVEITCRIRLKLSAPSIDFMLPFSQGQIFRYQDMPINNENPTGVTPTNNTYVWNHVDSLFGYVQGASPAVPIDTMYCKVRVRVLPSNNGIPNIVHFGGLSAGSSYCAMIEVTGHNTYLSFDDAPNVASKQKIPLEIADQPGNIATYP